MPQPFFGVPSGSAWINGASVLFYRLGKSMRCPECGKSQWLIGRIMAECACCQTALPLDQSHRGWSGAIAPIKRVDAQPMV